MSRRASSSHSGPMRNRQDRPAGAAIAGHARRTAAYRLRGPSRRDTKNATDQHQDAKRAEQQLASSLRSRGAQRAARRPPSRLRAHRSSIPSSCRCRRRPGFRDELDLTGRFARAQHRHDVGERDRLELAGQEVANLERRLLLPEQDRQLRVHVLGQRRSGLTAAATAAARPPAWPARPRRQAAARRPPRPPPPQPENVGAPTHSTTRFDASFSSAVIGGSNTGCASDALRVQCVCGARLVDERGRLLVDGGFDRGQPLRRGGGIRDRARPTIESRAFSTSA